MNLLSRLFSSDGLMPHGHCYLWQPSLIWLHVLSDGLIALAYYSIPITLVYFVRRRKDLQFSWIFLCFALFIVACGTTHIMEIWTIWHPVYWLSGSLKAFTAAVSILTAILLVRLIPQALALPSPSELREANLALEQEIVDRKRNAERVELLNHELIDKAALLATSNKELESFSYTVSHDLRAPLRHIRGFAEILHDETAETLSPEAKIYLAKISTAAMRMDALIDDLLNFSRVGRAELQHAVVKTDSLVAEVVLELQHDAAGRKIDWKIAPLPEVRADPALLRQVWVNLLSNAVKYTREKDRAEIVIGVNDRGESDEFFVRDNGAGFDMQYVGKLFGIFERLHQERFEGTGVGLANVRRIVERHGGKTWAEGTPNAGATFHFTLPKNP